MKKVRDYDMKHAYLIMCHNNFEQLKLLLKLLDDERNDIYVHIDKKAKSFCIDDFNAVTERAGLTFVKRINVSWGGYSLIAAEMNLLKAAVNSRYSYYHLLSGVDLPIKSQNEIHDFFEKNAGKEFISVDESSVGGSDFSNRIGEYHLLQDFIGRNSGLRITVIEKCERLSLMFQKKMRVNRNRHNKMVIYKGSNWFSITHDMVLYVLDREREIKRCFGYGLAADELFLQTIAMHSPYKQNITGTCMRLINWDRGEPHTFTEADYEMLIHSDNLFARKFDYSRCPEIVNMIYNNVEKKNI